MWRASRCSWAPRPGSCSSLTTRACARSSRRSAAAPPSTPRTSRGSRSARSCASRAIPPRIRSGATRRRRSRRPTRLVTIAREAGKRVHVLHVSTAEEMQFLADHKDVASVEVTPQHLTLAAPECYARLGTRAQMNPPIRDARHREALWQGVANGVADILGSDHAPHTIEEKAKPYPASPVGHAGRADARADDARSRERGQAFARALRRHDERRAAAAVRHRQQGPHCRRLRRRFHRRRLSSAARRSPINGSARAAAGRPTTAREVTGWPVGTFVRGHRVMWEGEIVTPAQGAAVRFLEALPPSF